jgi:hypothetical protein
MPLELGVRAKQRQTFGIHLQHSAVGGQRQGGRAMQTLADVVGHQRLDRTPLLQGPLFYLLHQVNREIKRGFHRTSTLTNQFTGLLGMGRVAARMVLPTNGCTSAFIARLQRPFQLGALKDAQLAIDLHGDAGAGPAG